MLNYNGGVKSKQQMADEYGVCRKTFNKLLINEHIKLKRGVISPREQKNIYNKLGTPAGLKKTQNFLKIPNNSSRFQ
jgi:hypothetical protein